MADISLETVAGKLNRVGYEAFFQALRQAKRAGNRHVELAHWPLLFRFPQYYPECSVFRTSLATDYWFLACRNALI